jgi:hypothetical protein
MDTITLIGVIAVVILGATSGFLALWCEYKDGVFGHVSLALMALVALMVVGSVLEGVRYEFLSTTTAMLVGMACFMLRHAYRAWRFRK